MKKILSIMTIILFTAFLAAQTDSTNINHGNVDENESTRTGNTYGTDTSQTDIDIESRTGQANEGTIGNTYGTDTSQTDIDTETRTGQANEGTTDDTYGTELNNADREMNQSMTQTEGDSALKYASFDEISEKTSQKLMSNLNLTNDQLKNINERLKEFQLEIGQIKFESQEEGTETDLKTGSNEEFQEEIKEIENEALEDISDIIDDNQKDQFNNIKTQWWNEFTSVVYSGYDASTPDQNIQQNDMNNDDQINIDENQNRDNDQMNENNSEDSNQIEDDNQNY